MRLATTAGSNSLARAQTAHASIVGDPTLGIAAAQSKGASKLMAAALPAGQPAQDRIYGNLLNKTSIVVGNLFFEGTVRIEGKVDGDIVASAEVSIGQGAQVTARIQAPVVSIHGKLSGDIIARRIELGPTARVVGNLTCANLTIDSGAVLDGLCSVSGSSLEAGSSEVKAQTTSAKAPVLASIPSQQKQQP